MVISLPWIVVGDNIGSPVGLDEGRGLENWAERRKRVVYLNITRYVGEDDDNDDVEMVVEKIRKEVLETVGLTVSAGISCTRYILYQEMVING